MDINAIRSMENHRSIHCAAYGPHHGYGAHPEKGGVDEGLEISALASLKNAVSQMSDEDKESIQSFMDDLRSSVQDGSFNAEAMAASAPDALTSYAEENDIDLTTLIQDLADGMEDKGGVYGPPPPPPPMMPGLGGLDTSSLEDLSEDEISEIQSFMDDLTASVQDGTFDAETMAEEAPEALSTLASENGMELTDLLEYMAEELEEGADAPPPPPPPMMHGARGMAFYNQALTTTGDDETSAA